MINKISYLVIKVMLSQLRPHRTPASLIRLHKVLRHNNFHGANALSGHPETAISPKKLTQIYHNYLKTPHFEAIFFTFFINNDVLSPNTELLHINVAAIERIM